MGSLVFGDVTEDHRRLGWAWRGARAASKRGESPAPAFLAALPRAFSKSVTSGIFLLRAPSNGPCQNTRSEDAGVPA